MCIRDRFTLQHKDPATKARAGELTTDHGVIRTPIFMPVGTAATVKGIFHRDVRDEARAQIILANTYHLYMRPGMEIIEKAGGVHRFSTWEGPMLTDSGGFQVFSLAACRKLKEEGCHFRSHIDGSKHLFTPESVMDTERTIGADIMMAFDECPPGDAPREYAAKSLALTERWLERCFNRYHQTEPKYGHYQALFPIVFDCVMPTRNGRNGQLFTAEGVINIRNKKWEDDFSPIDPEGTAFVDTLYTKAYLHHLVTCGEMLAAQIASLHNIAFYLRLVGMAREHIAAGDFKPWKDAMVAKLTRRL